MTRRQEIVPVLGKQPKRLVRQARVKIESEAGRRALNRQEKLARISEAARVLFRRKGFTDTTTLEVAERAGIGAGTLFLYADTKEDLLLLAFLGEILDVMEHISASVPLRASLTDQALHLLEGMYAYHAEDMDLTRHLLRELSFVRNPQRRAEVGHVASTAHDKLQAMVERAQKAGEVDPTLDARAAAMDLFALFLAPLSGWTNEFITREAYVRGLRRSVACLVAGMAAKGRKPP